MAESKGFAQDECAAMNARTPAVETPLAALVKRP